METALSSIHINGEPFNIIRKPLSAPEILVIRHLHGEDAVHDPERIEDRVTTNEDELDRLRSVYGVEVVAKLFPGALPRLPSRLSEVGIVTESAEAKPARKAKEA